MTPWENADSMGVRFCSLSRGRFLSSELNAAVVEPARAEGVDKALAGCLYSLGPHLQTSAHCTALMVCRLTLGLLHRLPH